MQTLQHTTDAARAVVHPPWCDPTACTVVSNHGDGGPVLMGLHQSTEHTAQPGVGMFVAAGLCLWQSPRDDIGSDEYRTWLEITFTGRPPISYDMDLAEAREVHRILGELLAATEGQQ